MAEPRRRGALDGCVEPGVHGAIGADGAGVTLREMRPLALAQVHGAHPDPDADPGLRTLAPSPAPRAGAACTGAGVTLLWNGPGDWLAVSDSLHGADLLARLREAFAATGATVTDLGHARTVVRITGARAPDLLAKGCPIDVAAMESGDTAASLFGPFQVQVHRLAGGDFDVYVARSFGRSLWESLVAEAAEFGCRVAPGTD